MGEETLAADHKARVRVINRAIQAEEERLRERHTWLKHQDILGLVAFFGSLVALVVIAAAYLGGALPWWLTIPLMALPVSILHELEHDLIHNLYFKGHERIQDAMFFVIWWSKLNGSPWYRRGIHLRHHKRSGQKDDVEERMIGLGQAPTLHRLLIAIHPIFANKVLRSIKRAAPDVPIRWGIRQSALPFALFALWFFGFPVWMIIETLAPDLTSAGFDRGVVVMEVLMIAPNILRQACLALLSSYSHYYGDIPEHDVFTQNQILDHWALWPMQLFAFNFGATHILHHYVVQQPFYLRQMVWPGVRQVLVDQGVRVNDFGVVRRWNRWSLDAQPTLA